MSALTRQLPPALSIVSPASTKVADPCHDPRIASLSEPSPRTEVGSAVSRYSRHPVASSLELPRGGAYEAMRDAIAEHGLKEPILLCDGYVLDGWNRLQACIETGCEPRYATYEGDAPVDEFVRLNLGRRHLSEGQRAALIYLAADPDLQAKHGGARNQAATLQHVTVAVQAKAADCHERTMATAKRIGLESSSMLRRVLRGELSLGAAEAELFPKEEKPESQPIDPHATCNRRADALQTKLTAAEAERVQLDEKATARAEMLEAKIAKLEELLAVRDARITQLCSEIRDLKGSGRDAEDIQSAQSTTVSATIGNSLRAVASPLSGPELMGSLGAFESPKPNTFGGADGLVTNGGRT